MFSKNFCLGFDHMRAAVIGNHDLSNAFVELVEMAGAAKDMSLVQGGVGCLLACVRLIENKVPFNTANMPAQVNELLSLGVLERAKEMDTLMAAGNFSLVSRRVATMTVVIQPYAALFAFKGTLAQELSIHLLA